MLTLPHFVLIADNNATCGKDDDESGGDNNDGDHGSVDSREGY